MSAFMVQDKTINRIVTWLKTNEESQRFATNHPLLNVESATLGQAMFDLNIQGVNARYGDGEAKKFRPLDYQFKKEIFTNAIQVYKSLGCFLYQCSEGNVPDNPLYKELSEYKNSLARAIVCRLPAYDKAEWG
jgi:hypothetical protein